MSLQGVFILIIFIAGAILMMTKRLPALIALPAMAIIIGLIAGISIQGIFNEIIGGGTSRLSSAMAAAIFGAMLAKVLHNTGISNTIIKKAAELGGDKPLTVALVLTGASVLIFTTLGGLGSVIMVGTIVLPLMISVGIKPLVAGCIMLLSLNLGGLFNLMNFAFYSDTLGVSISEIKTFSLTYGIIMGIVTLIYIVFNTRESKTTTTWSMPNTNLSSDNKNVSIFALLTPLIPILLVFIWDIDIIAAMIIGSLYAILVTEPKNIVNLLSSSLIEGIKDVAGALATMIGIGMLLIAVMHENTASIMQPLISSVLPSTKLSYILFFTILSPLALYRGPLNLWGLGSGIAGLMLTSGNLTPIAIMGALLAVGNIQGVCDPTNTHNVWTANFVEEDTTIILKKTLPYVLIFVVIALVYVAIFKW